MVPEDVSEGRLGDVGQLKFLSWSPDGNQFVYLEKQVRQGCWGAWDLAEIRVVNADATGRKTLVGPGCYHAVQWSPTGDKVMFTDAEGTGQFQHGMEIVKFNLRVVDASGGAPRTILTLSELISPAWSPDGQQIAFWGSSVFNGEQFGGEKSIWVVNADGSNLREVVPAVHPNYPGITVGWSRNGQQLVFNGGIIVRNDPRTERGVWIVNVDGTGPRLVVSGEFHRGGVDIYGPSWSPAGEDLILFARIKTEWDENDNHGIFVVRPDGSGERRLHAGDVSQPAWSPDGNRVAFGGLSEQGSGMHVINRDGSGLQFLWGGGWGAGPYWRPSRP